MKRAIGMYLAVVMVVALFTATIPGEAQAATLATYDNNKAGFDAAIAGTRAIELDFDELPNYAEVTDVYEDLGVTFSAKPCTAEWSGVHPDHPTARAGPGSLSASNPVSYDIGVGVPWDASSQSILYVEFEYPTSYVGAYFIDAGYWLQATLYDDSDNIIPMSWPNISPGGESGNSGKWWGVVVDERVIARMEVKALSYSDFFAIDNFVFQEGVIEGEADIDPDKLNLKSKGVWVTCYIELPEGYDVDDIDVGTVKISEVGEELASPIYAEDHPTAVGDEDEDGVADLMVKFDRGDLIDAMKAFEEEDEMSIVIDGALDDGTQFECEGRWVYTGAGWKYFPW